MRKRLLQLVLLVAVLLCVTVFAGAEVIDSGSCGDNLTWILTDDGMLTIAGTGAMYDFGNNSAPWYDDRGYIQKVQFGDDVTTIGNYAFQNCRNLTSVMIGESVNSIGYGAVYNCDRITSVTIPDGVTDIATYAFYECDGLISVVIGENVTVIGHEAFSACNSLSAIMVSEANNTYSSKDGVLFDKAKTKLILYPRSKACTAYTIPDSVTTIGTSAVAYCSSLTEVTIPDSVTTIGHYAFIRCSGLTEVTIPDSVTTIGIWAFKECRSLTSVTIGSGVTTIGASAFEYCSSLTEVTIPDSVTDIGGSAFLGCKSLTDVTIGNSVTDIGGSAFLGCSSLTDVTIGDSVTDIGSDVFSNCTSLTEVTIPNSVTSIGEGAFKYCSNLTEVTIPNSVRKIGHVAFRNCSSLTEVTIPNSVTAIRYYAFWDCSSLTEVTFHGNVPTIEEEAFKNVTATCYYPTNDPTWTADVMQNYGGTLTWVPYSTLPEFYGASMTLGNDLRMNYYVAMADLPETGLVASITRNGTVTTIPMTQWETSGSYYKITYAGIAAKEMAESISVVILDADGEPVSSEWVDGVRSYAMRIIDRESTPLKQKILLVDMLNYGAAAQENFNYNTDDLANAQLTEEHKALATGSVSLSDYRVKGTNYYGSALILSSNIQLKLYFSNVTPDMTAKVSYTNHMGVQKTVEKEIHMSGSYGYVLVEELVVADGRQLVSCTVTDTDGNVVAYVTDSLESYCFRTMDSQPLNDYLMRFVESAYSLFH